jgi:Ca-activated chloride channel homolog
VGVESPDLKKVPNLKYQKSTPLSNTSETATIKFRYKKPNGDQSTELSKIVDDKVNTYLNASGNFRFSASVALFGMLLSDSEYKGKGNLDLVINLAEASKGLDTEGYRSEFIRLAKTVR